MMKKIFLLCFCLLFLVSCSSSYSQFSSTSIQPPIEKIKWGMTKKEVSKECFFISSLSLPYSVPPKAGYENMMGGQYMGPDAILYDAVTYTRSVYPNNVESVRLYFSPEVTTENGKYYPDMLERIELMLVPVHDVESTLRSIEEATGLQRMLQPNGTILFAEHTVKEIDRKLYRKLSDLSQITHGKSPLSEEDLQWFMEMNPYCFPTITVEEKVISKEADGLQEVPYLYVNIYANFQNYFPYL